MIRPLAITLLCVACSPPVTVAPPPTWVAHAPVVYEYDATLRGHAGSYTDPHTGVCHVLLHPDRWGGLPAIVQHWTIGHEIAHCRGARSETEADCAAVRALTPTPADLATLVAHVQAYPASPVHPPGAVRAARILECSP